MSKRTKKKNSEHKNKYESKIGQTKSKSTNKPKRKTKGK